MNVEDVVYSYRIELNFNKQRAEKKIKQLKVLGISPYRIVFDDDWFTTIYHPKDKYGKYDNETYFDKCRVSHFKMSGYDEMTAYLYTYEKDEEKSFKRLKKELQKRIDKEFGKYGIGCELLATI